MRITKKQALAALVATVGVSMMLTCTPALADPPADPGTSSTGAFDPPPSIPAADVVSVTGAAGASQTVVFDNSEASVVTPGAVLTVTPGGLVPNGLLVRVVSVSQVAAGVEAVTAPAKITDAVAPGTYTRALTVPTPDGATTTPPKNGVSTGAIPWSLPINKAVSCDGTVNATLSGSLSVAPAADFSLTIDLTGVHTSLQLSMTEDAALRASLAAAAKCTLNVPIISNMPLPGFFVGPVYVQPTFSVTLNALLNASGSASVSGTQHFNGTVGVSYDPSAGLTGTKQATNTFDFDEPKLSGTASLQAGVTASVALLIEGVAGPRVDAQGYLQLSADSTANPWWSLYGGVTVSGGLQVLGTNLGTLTIWSDKWVLLQALSLSGATLPNATPTTAYSQQLHASGGLGSDTYGIVSGALPPGMSLSSAGLISGSPTVSAAGQAYTVVVRATDSAGGTASGTYSINVPALGMTPTLPAATTGTAYSASIGAIGAIGTQSWRVSSGALPAGLALGSSNGVISGVPTAATGSTFTVTLTDATGRSVSRAFTIAVTRVSLPACGLKGCAI